jgi:hypothetical protein
MLLVAKSVRRHQPPVLGVVQVPSLPPLDRQPAKLVRRRFVSSR